MTAETVTAKVGEQVRPDVGCARCGERFVPSASQIRRRTYYCKQFRYEKAGESQGRNIGSKSLHLYGPRRRVAQGEGSDGC